MIEILSTNLYFGLIIDDIAMIRHCHKSYYSYCADHLLPVLDNFYGN
jgi:hypothetical protein